MARRGDDIGDWIEDEARDGGLALAGWGTGAVAAIVLAFASWQYATPKPAETARLETSAPDPSEITGSIGTADRGQSTVTQTRSVGAGRVAPMPLAGNETLVTSRDIDQLRSELRDIQRRIVQIGMSGDGVSRRIDRIEERVAGLALHDAAAPPSTATEAPRSAEAAIGERLADRLPTPQPRPMFDLQTISPPAIVDADGPATTGAVPKTPRGETGEAKSAKTEAAQKAAKGVVAAALPGATAMPSVAASPPAAPPPAESPPTVSAPASLPAIEATAPSVAPKEAAAEAQPVRIVAVTPPAATAEAPKAPTPQAAAIDLGGFRTLASLRRSWSDVTIRYGDVSKGLEPLARLRETDSGMEARLLAGPFADQAEAMKACMRLKAAGAICSVTTYAGQPIGGLR